MKKINVAEILKNCPKGMELDCAMWDNVTFISVDIDDDDDDNDYPIMIAYQAGENTDTAELTEYGCWNLAPNAKCVIFPKGKNTWEGFQRPFKDGDIVFYNDTIAIFKEWDDEPLFKTYVTKYLCCDGLIDTNVPLFGKNVRKEIRLATEEEKQKLFQAIKENGYKWNAETKTLEKLTVKLKFKIGDRVQNKKTGNQITITKIHQDCYECDDRYVLTFENQDNWELIPTKFDITTLKPFKKVLARDNDSQKWNAELFSYYDNESEYYPFHLVGAICTRYCIPYEGNEHLLGKTDDCSEYFKTWKDL